MNSRIVTEPLYLALPVNPPSSGPFAVPQPPCSSTADDLLVQEMERLRSDNLDLKLRIQVRFPPDLSVIGPLPTIIQLLSMPARMFPAHFVVKLGVTPTLKRTTPPHVAVS